MEHANVEVGLGGEQGAGGLGLGFALGVEVDVMPTGKEVELVPFGAAVVEENEIWHVSSVVNSPEFSQSGAAMLAIPEISGFSKIYILLVFFLDKTRLNFVHWKYQVWRSEGPCSELQRKRSITWLRQSASTSAPRTPW